MEPLMARVLNRPALLAAATERSAHNLRALALDMADAADAAANTVRTAGLDVAVPAGPLTARARLAWRLLQEHAPQADVVVAGGETTVEVIGNGYGGRNQEVYVAALNAGCPGLILSLATDGIDGRSDAAGALADVLSATQAKEQRLDGRRAAERNDSNTFFGAIGATLQTGHTGTNVADVLMHIRPSAGERLM
jgi:glycerate 2-kinase